MKKILFLLPAALVLMLGSCGRSELKVTVSNPYDFQRVYETVEVPWEAVAKIASPENIIVTDGDGIQIPSQVLYCGEADPQTLIFQVSLGTREEAVYSIGAGVREDYKQQAAGRFVPERYDDYAWENNVIAFRMYGPALEHETISHGIDVWVKRTPELFMDKLYREELEGIASYHTDRGEGCDCYKVGATLGCGGSAPFVGEKLRYSPHNFVSQQSLDNGPVRTSFKLTYAEYDAGGKKVRFEKTISLDANTHFNKITDVYHGDFETLPIGAGLAMHDGAVTAKIRDAVALKEPASDSRTGLDGDIMCAMILPQAQEDVETKDNFFAVKAANQGEPFTYMAGAGWSKYGVENLDKWMEIVENETAKFNNPLQISYNY